MFWAVKLTPYSWKLPGYAFETLEILYVDNMIVFPLCSLLDLRYSLNRKCHRFFLFSSVLLRSLVVVHGYSCFQFSIVLIKKFMTIVKYGSPDFCTWNAQTFLKYLIPKYRIPGKNFCPLLLFWWTVIWVMTQQYKLFYCWFFLKCWWFIRIPDLIVSVIWAYVWKA